MADYKIETGIEPGQDSKYVIEKNIPIAPYVKFHEFDKFPLDQMNPGQSFFVPCSDTAEMRRVNQDVKNWQSFKRKHEDVQVSLRIRRVDGGLRIWLRGKKNVNHDDICN
jgi:hypothetical protein